MVPQDDGGGPDAVEAAVAVLLGSGITAWRIVDRVGRPARNVAAGLLSVVVGPVAAGQTAERGRAVRAHGTRLFVAALQEVTRRAVEVVLPALDVTGLVLRNVDIDLIAAALDVDAVVERVDLDAAVARVDLDAAVAQVDLDAIVDRVDLDAAVARVDLDAIVARIDVEAIALKLDLDRLAAALDVDAVVARADLDAAVARVDLDAAVARVDLVGDRAVGDRRHRPPGDCAGVHRRTVVGRRARRPRGEPEGRRPDGRAGRPAAAAVREQRAGEAVSRRDGPQAEILVPAGIVTRAVAAAIDFVVALGLTAGVLGAVAAVVFLINPVSYSPPPGLALQAFVVDLVVAGVYLTVGWAVAGWTVGGAVLGVRVVARCGGRLGWLRSGVRAVLCVVIPLGLLWAVVNVNRRSLQDLLVRSAVVYEPHGIPVPAPPEPR